MLEHANKERQNRFGEKLDKLRNASPTPETYERFNEKLENIVDQVDEIILELQDEREEVKARKGAFKDQYGETQLKRLRDEDADHVKLGEEGFEGELRRLNRKLEDWNTYRAEVQRIGRIKNKEVMDQVDAQSVKLETLQKLDEITKERVKDADKKIERTEEDLREEMRTFKSEMRQERRVYREELREYLRDELSRYWELVQDVLRPVIGVLEQFGRDVSELRATVTEQPDAEFPVTAGDDDAAADASTHAVENDDEPSDAADETDLYRFKDRDWGERYEELQRLVEEQPVDEMSQTEIVELTDLSFSGFYDKEDGTLVKIEEKYGDKYPELR